MHARLAALLIPVLAVAGEADPVVVAPGLGPVAAELRVNDVRWVLAQAGEMAGAAGVEVPVMQRLIGRLLLRCDDLSQLDPARSSFLFVRPQRQDLALLLPVLRRGSGVEGLGAGADGQPPLVRTGDRGGVMEYSRASADGLVEYRGQVGADWMAVAGTADEARRLLAAAPMHAQGAPVELRIDPVRLAGRWAQLGLLLQRSQVPPRLRLGSDEDAATTADVTPAWLEPVLAQVRDIRAELGPDAEPGVWRLRMRVRAQPETALAAWLLAQRPAPDRIGAALQRGEPSWVVAGSFLWQDQLATLLGPELARIQAIAPRWGDSATQAAMHLSQSVDRVTALGVAVGRSGGYPWMAVMADHPEAKPLMAAWSGILDAIHAPAQAQAGGVRHEQVGGTWMLAAGDDRFVAVQSESATVAPALASRVRASGDAEPGAPALVRMTWRFDRWLQPAITARRGQDMVPQAAALSVVATIDRGDLVVEAQVPVLNMLTTIALLELAPGPRVRR